MPPKRSGAFAPTWRRAHLSPDERVARGRQARNAVPRPVHGGWVPAPGRVDPVSLLEAQAATRVAELVPIRYGRMAVSPFTFYRGAALVMASDLATTPTAGITVQLCGDAHLSNFGLFGSPERRMLFDINDFDETLPGPWEWDVKRLAASFEILGREQGFTPEQRRDIVMEGVREYRLRIRQASGMPTLAAWYDQLEADTRLRLVHEEVKVRNLDRKVSRKARRIVSEAYSHDSTRVMAKRTGPGPGETSAPRPAWRGHAVSWSGDRGA